MIIRPELTEKNSDVIATLTEDLYPKYRFSVQQITNILLAIIIDNTPEADLKKAVVLCAQKAVKKSICQPASSGDGKRRN